MDRLLYRSAQHFYRLQGDDVTTAPAREQQCYIIWVELSASTMYSMTSVVDLDPFGSEAIAWIQTVTIGRIKLRMQRQQFFVGLKAFQ